MSRFLMAAALLVPVMLTAADPPAKDQDASKPKGLLGEYQIVEGAKYGEAIPPERLKDSRMIVTEKTIAVVDGDRNNLYSSTYTLAKGEEEGVWTIDLVTELPEPGQKAPGLVKLKGQQVWLIYSLDPARPDDFETGPKELMFHLKKIAQAAGTQPEKTAKPEQPGKIGDE